MNRIKYENYLGAAGYDAVARKKIKELEDKVGGGSGGGGAVIVFDATDSGATCRQTFEEVLALDGKFPRAVLNGFTLGPKHTGILDGCENIFWPNSGMAQDDPGNYVAVTFVKLPKVFELHYYADGHIELNVTTIPIGGAG